MAKLFPFPVGVAFGPIPGAEDFSEEATPLTAGELVAVARAVPKRKREFALGRSFAREALRALDCEPQELLRLDDGRPDWPSGIVGAITHSSQWAAAVVARNTYALGLGIDIEKVGRMSEGVARYALSESELRACESHEVGSPQTLWTLKFSAKESIYKCLYPIVLRFIGFQEAAITVNVEGDFMARLDEDLVATLPRGARLFGRYHLFDDHVVTACCLALRD